MPFELARSEVKRLNNAVWVVRFSLWFLAFELLVRKSLNILWNNKVRSVLLGVATNIGKRVSSRKEESMISFLRNNTKLPTIFSRNSLSRDAWCRVRISFRSLGKEAVSLGKQSATWATKSMRSRKETMPEEVELLGDCMNRSRCVMYWLNWLPKSSPYDLPLNQSPFSSMRGEPYLGSRRILYCRLGLRILVSGSMEVEKIQTNLRQPSPMRQLVFYPSWWLQSVNEELIVSRWCFVVVAFERGQNFWIRNKRSLLSSRDYLSRVWGPLSAQGLRSCEARQETWIL